MSVTFDSHLSFKEHSASIKSCNRLIWAIWHVRSSLLTQLLPLCAVSFSLAWITFTIPFSMVHLLPWSIIASSSKSPSWHIKLSQHPIHPISTTSFSAAMHLVFVHLPPFNYTNQFTKHPHQQRLLLCLFCYLECITSLIRAKPSLEPFKHHLKTHLFRTPTWI